MRRVLMVLMLFLLTGCSGKELGQVAIVRTMGVDAGVRVTAAAYGGEGQEEQVLSATAPSVAGAARAVRKEGAREVWYGHVDQMVVGGAVAQAGVESVVDYLAREPQIGPGVEVWAVEADAAAVVSTREVASRLKQLGQQSVTCTVVELMSVLARQGSVCVPALTLQDESVAGDGYALLRQGKLVDWLQGEAAAGYELLMGRGRGEVLCVDTGASGVVSVLLEDSRLRVEPVFQKEELVGLEIRCDLRGRIAQRERTLSQQQLEDLVLLYERAQGERLVAALERFQYWDADPAWLEQRAMLASPNRKEEIVGRFRDRYRTLDLRVVVCAEVDPEGAVSQ